MTDLKEFKQVSIVDFLQNRGIEVKKKGPRWVCSSPFASDKTPSFIIFKDNRYKCFSTGKKGDILDLVQEMEALSLPEAVEYLQKGSWGIFEPPPPKPEKPFSILQYYKNIPEVHRYAKSRGVERGYMSCEVTVNFQGDYVKVPCLGFPHEAGVKCRILPEYADILNQRYTSRGRLSYYSLDYSSFGEKECWIVEGEINANSWYMHLLRLDIPCMVVSPGGVTSVPPRLPNSFTEARLIIDYDGDEEKYLERLKLYSNLNVKPKKIILSKGEDVNTLYLEGKLNLIL